MERQNTKFSILTQPQMSMFQVTAVKMVCPFDFVLSYFQTGELKWPRFTCQVEFTLSPSVLKKTEPCLKQVGLKKCNSL